MEKFFKSILGGLLLSVSAISNAAWPERPISLVVPFPPGGATDIIGRVIAKELTEKLGVSVVVENRPGAAGNIGTRHVAKAKADGHTLLIGTTAQTISAAIYKNPGYDLVNDLESISTINEGPLILFTRPDLKVSNVKELIELAKNKPESITYATPGNGTSAHMAAEVFSLATGVKMVHVPYTGASPAMNDVMGGQVDIAFDLIVSAAPFIETGKVNGIGMATKERYPLLPNIPTLSEQNPENLQGFNETAWNVLMSPKDTPTEIVIKLNNIMKDILADETVINKFAELKNVAIWKNPEESHQFVVDDVNKWHSVVKDANIQKQ